MRRAFCALCVLLATTNTHAADADDEHDDHADCAARNDCTACLADADDPRRHSPCFWCADTASCVATRPDSAPFGPCNAVVLHKPACACHAALAADVVADPDRDASCNACTASRGCVWLEPRTLATMRVNVSLEGAPRPIASISNARFDRGFCWPGSIFGPDGTSFERTLLSGGAANVSVALDLYAHAWKWAQCDLRDGGLFAIGLSALVGVCFSVSVLVLLVVRRRFNRGDYGLPRWKRGVGGQGRSGTKESPQSEDTTAGLAVTVSAEPTAGLTMPV
jgi:hypothetical protein